MIGAGAGFQSDGASIISRGDAVYLRQREYPQDAADSSLAFSCMHGLAQRADMGSGYFGSTQQLFGRVWCARWPIFILNAVTTALLAQMLAQELPRARIKQPHMCAIRSCQIAMALRPRESPSSIASR